MAKVHWRYQWLWLYGFVHPESGETYCVRVKRLERFEPDLGSFNGQTSYCTYRAARYHGLESDRNLGHCLTSESVAYYCTFIRSQRLPPLMHTMTT